MMHDTHNVRLKLISDGLFMASFKMLALYLPGRDKEDNQGP